MAGSSSHVSMKVLSIVFINNMNELNRMHTMLLKNCFYWLNCFTALRNNIPSFMRSLSTDAVMAGRQSDTTRHIEVLVTSHMVVSAKSQQSL